MTLVKMMTVIMAVLMLICPRIYDNDDTAAAAHSDADAAAAAAAAAADADADAADDDGLGEDGCDGAATPAGRRPRPRE